MARSARGRNATMLVVVGIAVVAAIAGFLLGRTIKSPADIAAEAEAPEPSLITVPVELRELASNVIVRGDAQLEGSVEVVIDSSAGLETGGVPVVTSTPATADMVLEEGAVLIEIAGRPVIGLQGELPMFRTLTPGASGDDVEQLQSALARLGIDVAIDGSYDEPTERAVAELYQRVGYPAPGLTNDEQAQLDAARDAVTATQAQVTAAVRGRDQLKEPLPESSRLQSEASLAGAESAVEIAEAAATQAKAQAAATTAAAIVERTAAGDSHELAAARLAAAEGGTHPDTGLAPTAEELADLESALDGAAEILAAAEATVVAAEAGEDLVAAEQQRFVDDATTGLAIAQASHSELLAPPDLADAQAAINDAVRARESAEADLADLEARTGIGIPRAEIVFLRSMPTRVQRLHVARGDIVNGSVMTVSGAEITIESAVSASDRPLLQEGSVATVDDESLGVSFDAEITHLADEPGGQAADGRYFMRLTPIDDPGGEVAGLNLRVTIPITSTGGEVMTVPLAALAAGGDGSVRVEVESSDAPGTTRTVIVTTGLETTGFVEVTPVEGDLTVGDRVVVGRS